MLETMRGRRNNRLMKRSFSRVVTWVIASLAAPAGCAFVGYDLSDYAPADASSMGSAGAAGQGSSSAGGGDGASSSSGGAAPCKQPLDCEDGNACTTDSCDPSGLCVH